jgi:phosphatidylglycerophosphatase A
MTQQELDHHAAQPVGSRRSAAQHVMLFVGSLGYLGFVPIASGTVAVAVVGIPLYLLLVPYLGLTWQMYAAFIVAFTLVSIWVAGATDRILNEKDSHKNVIDEIPGYLIALVALQPTWQLIVAAFFLERAVDIAKIWPANWIERRLPRGWGVVLDDVVAVFFE